MFDLPLCIATSCDDRHPPESAIDGKADTFWSTTGLFPQELVVTLKEPAKVSSISTVTLGVRRLQVLGSESTVDGEYSELVPEVDVEQADGGRQEEVYTVDGSPVRHVKLVLLAGWHHFAKVYNVSVKGQVAS